MVVEVIDAPWSRIPVRIRWHNTALDMPRTRLPDRDLHRVQNTRCAHPGRVWPPRRSGGRLVSSVSREPLSLARPANQHCMTCTSHGSNGKISPPSLSTDARLKLIVQPAPAAAGSGLDLYEDLNVRVIGHYVLLEGQLFGFLVPESRYFSWLGPTMRMDRSCC